MANIIVLGDSTVWGGYDLEKGGWVNRLWLEFAQKGVEERKQGVGGNTMVYNLGISAGTSETLLASLDEVNLRLGSKREKPILIFQGGGNDSAYLNGKEDDHLVSSDKFEKNIRELINRAREISDKFIFVGFGNVIESKSQPIGWAPTKFYSNKNIKMYEGIMAKICEEERIPFVSLFGVLDETTDFADGIHPNAQGHQKIYKKVRLFLDGV